MKNTLLFVFLIVVGGIFFYSYKNINKSAPDAQTSRDYVYTEQFRTNSKIFYCATRPQTESGCNLYTSDMLSSNKINLNIALDYGSEKKGLLLSPDKKHVLVVLEKMLQIINTETLEQKNIAQAPDGNTYGTYTSFPSFVPYATWVNNNQVRVSIFKQYTPEPYENEPATTPIETRVITINE